jgi:hypothetical protein
MLSNGIVKIALWDAVNHPVDQQTRPTIRVFALQFAVRCAFDTTFDTVTLSAV